MDVVDLIYRLILVLGAWGLGFIVGGLLLGIHVKVRESSINYNDNKSRVGVLTPLLEVFKGSIKKAAINAPTTSPATRRSILAAWVLSTFLAFFFTPFGPASLVPSIIPNLFGQFHVFAIFGLLMVYPVGGMVMCFLSSRKVAIYNLKPLAEGFFSVFLTFLLSILSFVVIYQNGLSFSELPSINEIIEFQGDLFIAIGDTYIPALMGLLNPLAMIAFASIIPFMFKPFMFASDELSKKWTPLADFSGKSLGLVKCMEIFRFVTLLALVIDIFMGGGIFFQNMILDTIAFIVLAVIFAVIFSTVKNRNEKWVLDIKVIGFIRVHNLIAIGAFVLSIVFMLLG